MSHYIILTELCKGDEERIRSFFSSRPYVRPGKCAIQIREVKLYDFAVPEQLEDEFIKDISSQHNIDEDGGEFGLRKKLIKGIKRIVSFMGLKKVELDGEYLKPKCDCNREDGRYAGSKAKFLVLGELEDAKNEKGKELF